MAVKERVLLVGGPRDGEWLEIDADVSVLELPPVMDPDPPIETDDAALGAALNPPTTIYLRCTLHMAVDEPVSFFRPAAITDRQALLWMMAGHGNRQRQQDGG
ncbi:MAG: hypothetical protein K9G48_12640 [Reyranella sp.]|nr:hypothetical protein [Reyranella sp.]